MLITTRKQTKRINIGNIELGHRDNVVIQSMTNTKTANINKTLLQIQQLVQSGCELVRVAVLDQEDVAALKELAKRAPCPLIADIHYNYVFAIKAIESGVAKIRINPHNIKNQADLKKIVDCAKKHDVAIRIGINQGSIINVNKHKDSDLVNEAIKYVKLFESWGFYKIVVSLKTSDPLLATEVYSLAAQKIKYPLHLGVTEAGSHDMAIIKTAIGLAPILRKGIGDTIRVSISGSPLQEPIVAKRILNVLGLYPKMVNIVSCPTCGRLQWNLSELLTKVEDYTGNINKHLTIAIMGCSVNGIGEALKADVALYGTKNEAIIYRNGKKYKTVSHKLAFDELTKIISR